MFKAWKNSAWGFWGLIFGPEIFGGFVGSPRDFGGGGFDFCTHSIIPVTWKPDSDFPPPPRLLGIQRNKLTQELLSFSFTRVWNTGLSCKITPPLVEANATTLLGLRAVTFNLPLTNERLLLIKFCLKLNLSTNFLSTFCRRQHKVQHNILIPLVMCSDSRSVKSDPWLWLKSLNVNCCFNSANYVLNEWHGIWCSLGGMPFSKTHQQKLSGGESFLKYIRRISISTNS